TQAEYILYNRLHSRVYNAEWGMLMVQHWSQNEYAEESRYVVDANTFNQTWASFYSNALNELRFAKDIVTADEGLVNAKRINQLAIIEILMVDAFHALTDGFGMIPYAQSLDANFPNPQYDEQSFVYEDLLNRLDASLTAIDVNEESFTSGDIIFNGDMAAWKKLGASLMMRIAMRASDANSELANNFVNKANGHGIMSSTSDNALLVFDGANPDLANPLYIDRELDNRDDFAVSDVLVNTLRDMDDPRLEQFAAQNPSGEIQGMPYGLTDAEAFALKSITSRPAAAVRSASAPHVIMDFAEVSFLKAEAIERGYLSGTAEDEYNAGVGASMTYWGITSGLEDYLAKNPYDASNWKSSIGTQKWIAFYMNGPQAWAEWRRLDFPVLEVPAAATNPSIPVRLPYPISEDTNNGSNLDAVTTNINDLNTKMWWDVN
ncbi:MAG: SusD/RagB family nutrient-binding outer membrane lipoprotein, partial [Bacteroidota bacterium]